MATNGEDVSTVDEVCLVLGLFIGSGFSVAYSELWVFYVIVQLRGDGETGRQNHYY